MYGRQPPADIRLADVVVRTLELSTYRKSAKGNRCEKLSKSFFFFRNVYVCPIAHFSGRGVLTLPSTVIRHYLFMTLNTVIVKKQNEFCKEKNLLCAIFFPVVRLHFVAPTL